MHFTQNTSQSLIEGMSVHNLTECVNFHRIPVAIFDFIGRTCRKGANFYIKPGWKVHEARGINILILAF